MQQCQTCGATYEPILSDGMQYFHACAPLAVHELRDAHAAGALRLSAADQARFDAATKADADAPVDKGQPTRVDLFYGSLVVERPNKRDENVRPTGDRDNPSTLKAEGAGVLEIVDISDGPTRLVPGV